MAKVPRISDAEWEVMNVLWDDAPLGAADVAERLAAGTGWTEATVKTLLGRLVRKGALTYSVDGRRYLYRPRVTRERCVRAESRSFVERVLGGRGSRLLVHLVEQTPLSPGEIDELRRLLDDKEAS